MPKHHRWRRYYSKRKRFDHVFNWLALVAFGGLVLIVIDTYV